MLELGNWNVGMSTLAAVLLVAGALLVGAIAQFIGDGRAGYHWAVVALATLVGGWLGSEAFGTFSTWAPTSRASTSCRRCSVA